MDLEGTQDEWMKAATGKQVCAPEAERVSEAERKGWKGERKNEGMERAEKEGCRCGNKNGQIRQAVRERHMQRWRFLGELTYFSNECI